MVVTANEIIHRRELRKFHFTFQEIFRIIAVAHRSMEAAKIIINVSPSLLTENIRKMQIISKLKRNVKKCVHQKINNFDNFIQFI